MKSYIQIIMSLLLLNILIGCSSSDSENPTNTEVLVLEADKLTLAADGMDQVIFKVLLGEEDVTSKCVVWDMNNTQILKESHFSTSKTGSYRFVAKVGQMTSNELLVEAQEVQYFKKRLLIQQLTSTNCPNCPGLTQNLKSVVDIYPQDIYVLAYHGQFNEPDPFQIREYIKPIADLFNRFQQYPIAILDQQQEWSATNPDIALREVEDRLNIPGNIGIALNTTIKDKVITVDVRAKSLIDFNEQLGIAVAISESYLVAPQLSGRDIIEDYVHDHVIRKYLTDIFGDEIEKSAFGRNKEFSKKFSYRITSEEKWNEKSLAITAYILNKTTKEIYNCCQIKLGESKDFQFMTND